MTAWIRTAAPFIIAAGLLAFACASSGPMRWEAYPGCNAAQCKEWADACTAECLTEKKGTTVQCENMCNAKISDCEARCGG